MNYLKLSSHGTSSKRAIAFSQKANRNSDNAPAENYPETVAKITRCSDNEGSLEAKGDNDHCQERSPNLDWLTSFQQNSQLLMAAVELPDFTLRYANEYFCRLTGIESTAADMSGEQIKLFDLLTDLDGFDIEYLYKLHLLQLIFRDIYQIDISSLQPHPIVATVGKLLHTEPEPRWVEFGLRLPSPETTAIATPTGSSAIQMKVFRINPNLDEFADLKIEQMSATDWEKRLRDPGQIQLILSRLNLDNYRLEGLLLLEGTDVTVRETQRRLTNILLDHTSILRPKKFRQVNQLLRLLFRAQNTLILTTEKEEARLFFGPESKLLKTTTYLMQSLQGSHFLKAAEANQVFNVPDLNGNCPTECERTLLKMGVRSMLLIPLVVKAGGSKTGFRQLAGVIGLTSDQPHNFNSLNSRYGEELILPFSIALRQLVQQRFTQFNNIHPAVEWKFLQEAERRSWGMTPEPIVFNNVYPLYGISDIRGSSQERNRAIQADLLEQYHLALAVIDAFCQAQPTSLGEQLRLDLLGQIEQLHTEITVDAEVSAIRYLRVAVEIYFGYFAQCNQSVLNAVEAYRAACDNEHECIYNARDHYDQTIGQINALLRETWDRWQVSMQNITPHYCDIESTDGIDHMIYAGVSIDPNFCAFHLRSLRYEQLRAICDCARTAFTIQAQYNTKMEVTHLVLVQDATVDIFHNEDTEKLFEVRGTRDTRYELVKKRIDKAVDAVSRERITQPGMLTIVFSTDDEYTEYQQYLRYLSRENWIDTEIQSGMVEPLQGVTGLKFLRVRVLPDQKSSTNSQMADGGLEPST